MEIRRVVVTGIGIVSPLGHDPKTFFDNLANARSGVRRIDDRFDSPLDAPVAATVEGFDPATHFPKTRLLSLDRVSQFALVAARQAIEDAQLEPARIGAERVGVSVGTGMGGAGTLDSAYDEIYVRHARRVRPLTLIAAMNNAATANLSIEFGMQGASFTHSAACASSAIAIGEAARHIRHGYADAMLAGGAESLLTLGVIRAWEALRTLANMDERHPETSCRPFAADRSGFVLGEGAGFIVLEELSAALRRGARPYAELCGYGANSDAHHLTQPNAVGQAAAMRQALADAGMEPDEIGYVNAHGTATAVGDAAETAAIKAVFGERAHRLPVSSTKSMHGHLLGAAGAVEFIASLLALKNETLPPTAHLQVADPECDLDYVPLRARPAPGVRAVMSNSFAFGGSNAALIARRLTH
ncbi:beta-ketoacyl-[acyl-carrier-protein] synthase family protein [Candidatus Ferrigenium straubiae]|jgi:3-oxoacyl-[acyl-carrier-protein] synthase II|uniref:beta-ketoacyl-[acyl-carrier-protein] synthase family protein n=1 Tax=Candidatus Ferrigenium straubiae TaxID=2919506 RepID=UPI003F4AA12E